MNKVFLGGTCGNSTWREKLITMLNIDYFNPVVDDWTPECQLEELKQREQCGFLLYVITPEMDGVYSIAEVVEDSIKQPARTIFCVLESIEDKDRDVLSFKYHILKSLEAVGAMVKSNGATYVRSLLDVADILNYVEPNTDT